MNRVTAALAFVLTLGFALGAAADPRNGAALDLTTPRRAVEEFLAASREGNYELAANVLDLRGNAVPRGANGALLARRLKLVLDAKLWLDLEAISDDALGDPNDGAATDTLGAIRVERTEYSIQLRRVYGNDGPEWLFSGRTVSGITPLYDAYGPGLLGERMPTFLTRVAFFDVELWQWGGLVLASLLSALIAAMFSTIVLRLTLSIGASKEHPTNPALMNTLRGPTRFFVALIAMALLVAPLHLAPPPLAAMASAWRMLLVSGIAWYLLRLVDVVADGIERRALATDTDPLKIRGVRTQVQVLKRVLHVVVAIVGTALVLLQFEVVRNVGVSLLASAGVAGIVLGFAAQKSIGTLLAGIQLSITQPIRIGDTVMIDQESGTVEEITLTYVIVELWDQRRLIVPITHFLDKPFQNWTRSSSAILGTVDLFCEFTTPVSAVRDELKRFVMTHTKWDERKAELRVMTANERTITLRALVSAKDADSLAELRYDVREHMIAYLQKLDNGMHLPHAPR